MGDLLNISVRQPLKIATIQFTTKSISEINAGKFKLKVKA